MLDWKREVQTVKFECRRIRQDDETSDRVFEDTLKGLNEIEEGIGDELEKVEE